MPARCAVLILMGILFLGVSARPLWAEFGSARMSEDERSAYEQWTNSMLPLSKEEIATITAKAHKFCDKEFKVEAGRNKFVIQEAFDAKLTLCYMDKFSRLIIRDNWEKTRDVGLQLVDKCVTLNGKAKTESCAYTGAYYFYTKLFSLTPPPFLGDDVEDRLLQSGSDELFKSYTGQRTFVGSIMACLSGFRLMGNVLIMSLVGVFFGIFILYVLFQHMNLR